MQKLILIDACMRDGESRTRRILEPLMSELGKSYEIETVVLDGEDYQAVGRRVLAECTRDDCRASKETCCCRQDSDRRSVLGHEFPCHPEGVHREHVAVQYHIQGQRDIFRGSVQMREGALHHYKGHECEDRRTYGGRDSIHKGHRRAMGTGR